MRRARQAAGVLGDAIGGEAQVDDRLAEFALGHTSYNPPDPGAPLTAEQRERGLAAMNAPSFVGRVTDGIDDLVARHSGERIAVVCHMAVILQSVGHLTGFEGFLERSRADYASVTRVFVKRNGHATIDRLNDAPWYRLAQSQ